MAAKPGRTTAQFKRNAAALRAKRLPCWLCGQPINYDISGQPDSFVADHIKPLKTHPNLADDPANIAPAHWRCNANRGTGQVASLGQNSRTW